MTSQLEILEQRLFTAFASADWRDPETRERVYAAIERAIQKLADRPEAEASYQGYVDAFAELRWRVERSVDDAADLDDLATRIAAFSAPEAEEPPPPPAPEPPPAPPPAAPPTAAPPPFRPAPPLVADAPPFHDDPRRAESEPDPEPAPAPRADGQERQTLAPPPMPDMHRGAAPSAGLGERDGVLPRPSLMQRLALPVVGLLAGLALLIGLFAAMRQAGPEYDSGWVTASNSRSNVVEFRHGFGAPPRTVTIWFSADRGVTASLVAWKWPASESGNPISVISTRDVIELHIWNGAPLHGTFDTQQNRWTTHTTGFFRVVAGR